jgi:L-rhamnose isomerase
MISTCFLHVMIVYIYERLKAVHKWWTDEHIRKFPVALTNSQITFDSQYNVADPIENIASIISSIVVCLRYFAMALILLRVSAVP